MPIDLKLLDHLGHAPALRWDDAWKEPSRGGWHDLSRWVAEAWFESHDAFHDGRLTSYMLRAFGYPNLFAYDEVNHGNAWLLDVGDGWGLSVQPFPFEADGYRNADRDDQQWMLNGLRAHRIFELMPVRAPDRLASPSLAREIAEAFRRPVRFRDVLMNASSVSYTATLDGLEERACGDTANVVIDPRFRRTPSNPKDLVLTHPSRQPTGAGVKDTAKA